MGALVNPQPSTLSSLDCGLGVDLWLNPLECALRLEASNGAGRNAVSLKGVEVDALDIARELVAGGLRVLALCGVCTPLGAVKAVKLFSNGA